MSVQPEPAPASRFTRLDEACIDALGRSHGGVWGIVERRGAHRLVPGPRIGLPEDLIGFTAPRPWVGAVVAFSGEATRLDTGARSRVHVGFALDRAGRSATRLTDQTGEPLEVGPATPQGHVHDVCQRMFGRPTPDEHTPPVAMALAGWLTELVDLARDPAMSGWASDWNAVADIHPLAAGAGDLSPEGLGLAARSDAVTWAGVRRCAIDRRITIGGFTPADAAWLDAGSLARFLLATRPSLGAALAEAGAVLPAPVLDRVRSTISLSGIPTGDWPIGAPREHG